MIIVTRQSSTSYNLNFYQAKERYN